jgi:hydroxymethylglutaryl-CoA lyase
VLTDAGKLNVVEVSPRDGLQNESTVFSTEDKVTLIESAWASGLRRIEVCSFVNPKRVPQMADAESVLLSLSDGIFEGAIGLVLNERGLDRALDTPLKEVNYVVVVTETFSHKNQGMKVAETIEAAGRVVERGSREGLRISITLSAAFGCPFEGEVPVSQLVSVAKTVSDFGPFEIALADTIGVAVPTDVKRRIEAVSEVIDPSVQLRCHFHNTRNTGFANAWAAIEAGVLNLDASLGGVGGCPFAPNATGNIATEDLIYLAERSGVETGVDVEELFPAIEFLQERLGKVVPGLLSRAGVFPSTYSSDTNV